MSQIYEHLNICHIHRNKKIFFSYEIAHNIIVEKQLDHLAPYLCRDKSVIAHYHLTSRRDGIRKYNRWKGVSPQEPPAPNLGRKNKGSPEYRLRKKLNRRRRWMIKLATAMNKGMTHKEIMDEIELGF